MEKFGMSFGGGPSRKELLETVESQKKQLAQYQSRFRDVVQAYKSLLKEKEALEASLKVLSTSHFAEANQQVCERAALLQDCGDGADVTPAGEDAEGEDAVEVDAAAERREVQLRSQVGTLTGALATVTQEKSHMEAGFQADKRRLKQEADELRECLAASAARQQAEVRSLQTQLAESRARVITQQHEREREQSDQLQQLQELQKILQQERDLRRDMELCLCEADAGRLAADRRLELEALLRQAGEERDQLRRELRSIQEERERADPGLELLRQELSRLKGSLQEQICKLRQEARAHAAELRVGGLEQRVSELSDLLGSCEKARQREHQLAQTLGERLAQLDAENQTPDEAGPDDSRPDAAALKDKLDKVKKLLLLAAHRNPPAGAPSEPEAVRDAAGHEELRQLRDELERYKLRAKAASEKSHTDGSCASRELEEARRQLADLRDKYVGLRVESEEAAAAQRRVLQQQQQRAAELLRRQREEAEREQAACRDELMRLEGELRKQRQRTVALLDQKDREMELLRVSAPNSLPAPGATEEEGEEEQRQADAVGRALRDAAPGEPALLLYAEQLARKEVETAGLRRHKRQLEDDVHRLHRKLAAAAQRHDEESRALRARLDELAREHKREGSDVEYLKNVIYRFLTLPDAGGRRQTLNAILSILHFSAQEKQSVLRQQGAPWWSAHKR